MKEREALQIYKKRGRRLRSLDKSNAARYVCDVSLNWTRSTSFQNRRQPVRQLPRLLRFWQNENRF